MKFKQIAVTRVGRENDNSAYSVALFALNEEGEIYALKTDYGNTHQEEWKKVSGPSEEPGTPNEITGGDEGEDMLAEDPNPRLKSRVGQ